MAKAPIDDEEETEEERTAIQEAKEAVACGEVRLWAKVSAELERRARDDDGPSRKVS